MVMMRNTDNSSNNSSDGNIVNDECYALNDKNITMMSRREVMTHLGLAPDCIVIEQWI